MITWPTRCRIYQSQLDLLLQRSLTQREPRVMISHELLKDKGVLIVIPEGPLEENDFRMLAEIVDPFIDAEGTLHGLMIYTETFPGWKNFSGLLHHLRFVKDHHQKIQKVAAVTDSTILSIAPRIADHFIHAEVKHFDYKDKEKALSWLRDNNH